MCIRDNARVSREIPVRRAAPTGRCSHGADHRVIVLSAVAPGFPAPWRGASGGQLFLLAESEGAGGGTCFQSGWPGMGGVFSA